MLKPKLSLTLPFPPVLFPCHDCFIYDLSSLGWTTARHSNSPIETKRLWIRFKAYWSGPAETQRSKVKMVAIVMNCSIWAGNIIIIIITIRVITDTVYWLVSMYQTPLNVLHALSQIMLIATPESWYCYYDTL